MPVSLKVPIRRISQQEFGELAFEVMRHVFAIHNEIGRFFDERIYKTELAYQMPGVRLEQTIDVRFDSFYKQYLIDVVVGGAGLFEFKAVESLAGRHRAQLLNYLLLCDVAHGKVINVRPENVDHEFVNSHWTFADRTNFDEDASRWNERTAGAAKFRELMTAVLRDLGTGLELPLYEEVISHFFGGRLQVETHSAVTIDGRRVGRQRIREIAPGVAFKVTGLDRPLDDFETHGLRFLAHSDLKAIARVNINMKKVTFTTLEK